MLQNIADSLYGDLNVLIFKICSIVGSAAEQQAILKRWGFWLQGFVMFCPSNLPCFNSCPQHVASNLAVLERSS